MSVNRRHLALGTAFLVALWLAIWGDKTPVSVLSADTSMSAGRFKPGETPANLAPSSSIMNSLSKSAAAPRWAASAPLRLIPRAELVRAASGPESNIFSARSRDAPSPPVARTAQIAGPPEAAAPSFTVLGKQFDGTQWAVYLGRGEEAWVVREGQSFDGDYTVQSIKPPTLSVLHKPTRAVQSLDIGGTP